MILRNVIINALGQPEKRSLSLSLCADAVITRRCCYLLPHERAPLHCLSAIDQVDLLPLHAKILRRRTAVPLALQPRLSRPRGLSQH